MLSYIYATNFIVDGCLVYESVEKQVNRTMKKLKREKRPFHAVMLGASRKIAMWHDPRLMSFCENRDTSKRAVLYINSMEIIHPLENARDMAVDILSGYNVRVLPLFDHLGQYKKCRSSLIQSINRNSL